MSRINAETTGTLSKREQEVLTHLVDGQTYTAIARRMGLSPHTVDTYLRRIRAKTGATNRMQLLRYAIALTSPRAMPAAVEDDGTTGGAVTAGPDVD
jgi:DNA-binding CsgD family transcriptional regulator